ncbi:MAG: hypothetical protein NT001_04260, partial [Candidatus Woesearchaeota archaeon]|nr:hypothetical protein [Candidatus Woesearchaeota archaeon]
MIKWFWSMKKPNAVLIWDTYKLTNFSSARFFEIKSNLEHQKIVKKDIYFGQKIVDNIRNEIRKNISSDPGYPDRISKKVYDTEKSVISKINKLTDKYFKKCSDKELCSIFSKCYKQVSIMEIPMSYRGNVQLSDILTETIKQELAKKLRAQGKLKLLDEYFLALSTPKRESYMSLGQKMVLELAVLKIKNDPSFDKELREHTKNFAWMGCVMFEGMPLTQEDFLKDINSKIEQNPEILLNKMEDSRKDSETKIKTIVTSLEFSKETLKTLEQLREWYHLRTYAKDCISKAIAKTMPVLLEIAARKNMTYDDLSFLQAREIENIFKISKEALQNRIEERKKGWAAV